MANSNPNPKVDFYFDKPQKWQDEFKNLRAIALSTGLIEELKWGCACYTYDSKNVVLIHGFKEYCALLFMKGALMKDPESILIQQTENVQSARQVRFTSLNDIVKLAPVLKGYINEAAELEKAGAKVVLKKTTEYKVPAEFQSKLDGDADLKKAFYALTPGRQKGYLFHFNQPKLAKTREGRVEKAMPMILDGKGLED